MVDEHFLEQEAKGWWRRQSATTKFFLRAILAFLVICIIVAAVNYTVTPAKAEEPCEPQLVYPPDLHLDCINGRLVVDSDLMPIRLETAIRCRSGMT